MLEKLVPVLTTASSTRSGATEKVQEAVVRIGERKNWGEHFPDGFFSFIFFNCVFVHGCMHEHGCICMWVYAQE